MADFVAVLRKTLDGLEPITPELRERVFQKARETISAKLAAIRPPPSAQVVRRQMAALESAISSINSAYSQSNPAIDDLDKIMADLDKDTLAFAAEDQDPITELERIMGENSWPDSSADVPIIPEVVATLSRGRRPRPIEPVIEEGPEFQIRGGKIAAAISPPGSSEVGQERLRSQIQSKLQSAEPHLAKVENKYPELVRATREYSTALGSDINETDVVSVWSIGASLIGFSDSYRQQNIDRTLSEPLEPETAALLDSIIRTHGAFIMGFQEGRDLVRKADEFLVNREVLDQIAEPGSSLLDNLALNKKLVEPRTIRANLPLADYVHEFGWSSGRAGYGAYILIRNITFQIVKFVVGDDITPISIAGVAATASLYAGDPNLELIRNSVPVLFQQSSQLLAFFKHSPEFRGYIEWALAIIREDREPTVHKSPT